jgi:predicted small metal-binding protein
MHLALRARHLECDCGYVAQGDHEDELVAAVQLHAREAHDMSLPAELILTLLSADRGPFHRVGPDVVRL